MLKRLLFFALLLSSSISYSKTVSSVAISPQGAVIVVGTSVQYNVVCTYSDSSTDNCAAAGGATWSTPTAAMSVNSSGLASWSASADPHNGSLFPYGAQTALGFVKVTAGGLSDSGQLMAQSPSDILYRYMTPDNTSYVDLQTSAALPINVVVGSTVAIGVGYTSNVVSSGNPFQMTCNWTSSNNSIATVSRYGLATAVAPGSVTITCGAAGNGVYGSGSGVGNTFTFNVVAPTPTSQTWYVRPNGGTPYVSSSQTPAGQCDGKHDADYPGSGVNQPCAVGNLRYLWADGVSRAHEQWMIGSGDTVIVRQKSGGYNLGNDQQSPEFGGTTALPVNCAGNGDCYMPTIPSGTASQHTRILGENYNSCHADSAKTQVLVSWGSKNGINVRDSQFVDVQCLDISDSAACAYNGNYTNNCQNSANFGLSGIIESALTASVNYTDLFIHGLAFEGIRGATGAGVVANYVHLRALPSAGIDMDDAPHNVGNISVAGGLTMNNSITEFSGCVEEYPVVHNYPYIECRDSETGSYSDGFGTASTTGSWSFDHDIWRYNFQDGLDLLHSGLQSLSVTNSQSYGNDGQAYKIGSADNVVFQNNVAIENCKRIGQVIGDEPASAIVPGVNLCRADGGWVVMAFTPTGTYTVQNNTFVGYGDVALGYNCVYGGDNCSTANTTMQNNVFLALTENGYNGNESSAIFCAAVLSTGDCNSSPSLFPANQGWATRSNNIYFGTRSCPLALTSKESCNTVDPLFLNEPPSTITSESVFDNFTGAPSASSPLIGSGIGIPNLLSDIAGLVRPNPPSIGAFEYAAGTSLSPSQLTVTATPNPATVGQSITLTATITMVGSVEPTGNVTFLSNGISIGSGVVNASGVATLSLSSLPAGGNSITVTYSGNSTYAPGASNSMMVTINGAAKTTTTTVLTASPNPATTSQAVTLTATVTATSGTATGTVAFFDGGTSLGSGTLSGSGVATVQVPSLTAGSHNLTAQYAGTSTFSASNSATVVETVNGPTTTATTTALIPSPNPATTTQAVILTATVTAASGTPTGTIAFFDGSTSLGSGTLNGSGVASVQVPSLTAGSHNLTAQYAGTSTFSASSSPTVVETVNTPAASTTTTTLNVSPNPATTTQAITLTATVTATQGTPTGSITFLDGTTSLGSATISGGVATIQVPTMTAGLHNLTAHYAGTSSLNPSASSNVVETVNAPAAATTATALTASPNPATTNQAITLTATVTTATGTPTGTVTFFDGGTSLGSGNISSGVASVQVPSFTAGLHNLTAQYTGTSSFNASASSVVTEIVNTPALIQTTTLIQTSANPIVAGQSITLTATVTAASGTPTGTVSFLDGTTPLGTATIASGTASIQVPSLAVGSHSLTAQYVGTSTFGVSASTSVTETVTAAALPTTITTLALSQNPSPAGQAVTLTATVTSPSGTPSGTVSFLSNGVAIGSGTLNGSGVATYTVASQPAGTYAITAQYAGSSTFNTSTSTSVSWNVLASGVTLALSTPSLTVTSGVPTSNPVTLTVTPFGGYSGTLQMACQSPAPGTTCTFQPQTVNVNAANGPTNVMMIVQTAAASASAEPHGKQPSDPTRIFSASILWIPGVFAAALLGIKRKQFSRSARLLLLLLLCGSFGAMTGCGSNAIESLAAPSPNTMALQVMVTGTGNVTQSITLSITTKPN